MGGKPQVQALGLTEQLNGKNAFLKAIEGSKIEAKGGVVDRSGTVEANSRLNVNVEINDKTNFKLDSFVLYTRTPGLYPHDPKATRIERAIPPENFLGLRQLEMGIERRYAQKKITDGSEVLHTRLKALKRALDMPDPESVVKDWTIDKLKRDWPQVIDHVAVTQLIAKGHFNQKEFNKLLPQAIETLREAFKRKNPGKPLVKDAKSKDEAMAVVRFVSKEFKKLQEVAIKNAYKKTRKQLESVKSNEEINRGRYLKVGGGLIDRRYVQGKNDVFYPYRNLYAGDIPPSDKDTGCGLGLEVVLSYLFGNNARKIVEVVGSLGVNAPFVLYVYGKDNKKPQFVVVNSDLGIVVWPWESLEIELKGRFSKGFGSLSEYFAYSGVAQIKVKIMDKENTSITIATAGKMGVRQGNPAWAAGLSVLYGIRKGHDDNKVGVAVYAAIQHQNRGKITDKPVQVEGDDGNTYSKDWGATDVNGAPVEVSVNKNRAVALLGVEATWEKMFGSGAFLKLNTGLSSPQRGNKSGPFDGDLGVFGLLTGGWRF